MGAYDPNPIPREQRPDPSTASVTSIGVLPDYGAVRKEIEALVKADPNKGPTLVRLAWHSSGTYSKITQDGGSYKGTIRFRQELAHGANKGLDTPIMWLEPVYKKVRLLS
jgi:cytochrome c peroxidase